MFLVVPVAHDYSKIVVIFVGLGWGVDEEGSTEAVNILTMIVGVYPVCAPLTRSIDRDLIRESLARRNAAADKSDQKGSLATRMVLPYH